MPYCGCSFFHHFVRYDKADFRCQDIVLQQGLLPMVEFPAVFGHEGAGVIREIGPNVKDKSLSVGDSVLLSFHTCGTCKQCVGNHPAYCHSHPQVNHNAVRLTDGSTPGTLQDGRSVRSQYFGHSSFARMSIVPQACVVKCPYPEAMPFYSPLGCGFQTGAGTIMNVLKPAKEQSVVIFGLGSVGLTALMACTHLGLAQVVAVDVVDDKLILAKELGATDMLNSRGLKDVVAEVKRITHGGADFTIDCTGLVPVIETMIDCLAPCGTAVTVGVPPPNVTIRIDPLTFLLENKRYIGVIEGDSVPQKVIES